MNYYKWNNLLVDGQYIDPIKAINETGVRLNPSFNDGDTFYGSSSDSLDIETYSDYSFEVVTEADLITAALAVNESAILKDGFIVFTNLERLYG